MKSGGLFVLGGLLAGAGKAITDNYEERRQMALLDLKRQWDTEDSVAAHQNKLDELQAQGQNQIDVINATGERNIATEKERGTQQRLTEATRGAEDRKTAEIKGNIDLSHDTQIEAIKHKYSLTEIQATAIAAYQKDAKLNHMQPDHYEKTADGHIVIWNKDGTTRGAIGTDGQFVPPGSGSDDEPTITGTAADRNGGAKPAAAAAKPSDTAGNARQKAQAIASLGNAYAAASANPEEYRQQYPGMFDADGKLLPRKVLIDRINQRYK
jgi:hypothetical protein